MSRAYGSANPSKVTLLSSFGVAGSRSILDMGYSHFHFGLNTCSYVLCIHWEQISKGFPPPSWTAFRHWTLLSTPYRLMFFTMWTWALCHWRETPGQWGILNNAWNFLHQPSSEGRKQGSKAPCFSLQFLKQAAWGSFTHWHFSVCILGMGK